MKYIRKYTLESDWEDDQQDREANVPVTSWLVDVDEVRYDHEEEPTIPLVLTSESNPKVFTILDEAGFGHEDPDGYTAAELGEITDADFYSSTLDSVNNTVYYSIFYDSDIETFDEFRYFTGITEIKHLAFTGCTDLSSIILPNSITAISGRNEHNVTIGGITYGTSVLSPFYNTDLSTLTIPNSVTSIGDHAFYECSGLTSVTIGNSVTSIVLNAFVSCTGLENITSLATTAPSIDYLTFYNIKTGGTLHVPSGSDYSTWMQNSNYYLGKYNWAIAYDA